MLPIFGQKKNNQVFEMKIEEIKKIIQERRSLYQRDFNGELIEKEILEELLDCANAAPQHKRTQPWRFTVFVEDGRKKLAEALSQAYEENTPEEKFLEKTKEALYSKPMESGAVIAVSVAYSGAVPAWEELAATACSVQNILIAASAIGLGGYWGTPGNMKHLSSFLQLNENEECLGFLYLGKHDLEPQIKERAPLADKVQWVLS